MKNKINIYLIEYAIHSILRQKTKSFFVVVILTLLIFLLSSVFLITNSLKYELDITVDSLPQIIVQKIKAGRHYDIDVDLVDQLVEINGVEDAISRVWGYYYFANAGVNFSIVGLNQYENQYKSSFTKIVKKFELEEDSKDIMVVGKGVLKVLKENYYNDYFNFIKSDGTLKKIDIAGVFDADTELESNDVIVMSQDNVREIFDIDDTKATDIVIKVHNPLEIQTIASKIRLAYPDTRVITSDDLKISYQNIFDYKSGIFLALFTVALFTFFIIIYDRASGLESEQKREIGILKAIGWKIDDILREKFYESFIISSFAYISGIGLSIAYVYIFDAPVLRKVFEGYSQLKTTFELPFIVDIQTLFLVFFLSVPIYVGAIIIPSWKIATLEADEVIR
jgi:ABC-type lipoprotein release transport system permease subunit